LKPQEQEKQSGGNMNFLVTGVSKGLGLEIARTLIKDGHTVYGISRNMVPELKNLIDENSGLLIWKSFDTVNTEAIHKEIFEDWIGLKNPIHGFVNNAAYAYDDIVTNATITELLKMDRINYISPVIFVKYAIRQMLLHGIKGSIVHISSVSAHTGYKGLSMYAATKGALEAFSKNVAREWGEKGIRSNCVVAGFMETDMSASLTEDQKRRIYQRTSLKCPVSVSSVAETVKFLLLEDSFSITGQNIFVDNGTI